MNTVNSKQPVPERIMLSALRIALEEIEAWRRWAGPGKGPSEGVGTSMVVSHLRTIIEQAEAGQKSAALPALVAGN